MIYSFFLRFIASTRGKGLRVKAGLLSALLFISCMYVCESQQTPAQKLKSDQYTYWYPTGEGSILGLSFVDYLKDYGKYDTQLLWVSFNMNAYKDSIIAHFKSVFKIHYINGYWVKFSPIHGYDFSDIDHFVMYIDGIAEKAGQSKGYMTQEEENALHPAAQQQALDKIHHQ